MNRWNILVLIAIAAAALCVVIALPAAPAFSDGHEEEAGGEEDALHEAMEQLGDDLKALRRAVVDESKKAVSLEIVARMQKNTWIAKGELPESVEEMEDVEAKHAAAASYRKQMAAVLAELCKLEIALIDGRQDDVIQSVRNLGSQQRSGHDDFRVDEDDD